MPEDGLSLPDPEGGTGPDRHDRMVVRVPSKRIRRKLLSLPGKSTN